MLHKILFFMYFDIITSFAHKCQNNIFINQDFFCSSPSKKCWFLNFPCNRTLCRYNTDPPVILCFHCDKIVSRLIDQLHDITFSHVQLRRALYMYRKNNKLFEWFFKHTCTDPDGGQGVQTPPSPRKIKNIGFLNNTDPDPMKITKLSSQNSMFGHHCHASKTSFKWLFAGGPMMACL